MAELLLARLFGNQPQLPSASEEAGFEAQETWDDEQGEQDEAAGDGGGSGEDADPSAGIDMDASAAGGNSPQQGPAHARCLATPPAHSRQMPPALLSSADVVRRIRCATLWFVSQLSEGKLPEIELVSNAAGNRVLQAGDGEGGGDEQLFVLRLQQQTATRSLLGRHPESAEQVARLWVLLGMVHSLLLVGEQATQRELWYQVKPLEVGVFGRMVGGWLLGGWGCWRLVGAGGLVHAAEPGWVLLHLSHTHCMPSPTTLAQIFRSLRDVAEAVQDAVALLGVPRSALGITASSKGLVAGRLLIRDQHTGEAGRWALGAGLLARAASACSPARLCAPPARPLTPTPPRPRHRHRLRRKRRRRADSGRRGAHLPRLGLRNRRAAGAGGRKGRCVPGARRCLSPLLRQAGVPAGGGTWLAAAAAVAGHPPRHPCLHPAPLAPAAPGAAALVRRRPRHHCDRQGGA